ncbi:O-antigen ligase family protein [Sphingomonas phyllosphaerae]|uniref:O-antigen ligase family protein n=1 Tax=Sphingomonas phyllosphaerae TaxID=257003 RepID=UPI0009DBADA2|nr:O-antigen ligase family protein [Sphingomonas phyllosphaerae]
MPTMPSPRLLHRPSLSFILFCSFLVVLSIAGGASRATVYGQFVVRLVAVLSLFLLALFGDRPEVGRSRPVWWLLLAAIGLAVLQLIPLPPALWQALPGRTLVVDATMGQPQPWRPLALVPGTTLNALASLIVPLTTVVMIDSIRPDERRLLPGVILIMIVAANLLGLMQLSGSGFNNPLINDSVGEMSGIFANRNHFALLLALGCLLVPAWVFAGRNRGRGRAVIGVGLTLLLLMTIVVSGSRAGLLLGALALAGSLLVARSNIRRALRRAPTWAFPALIAAVAAIVAIFVLISVAADRAVSIQRIFEMDAGQDMRGRALPTVWAMTLNYFPAGAGLGSFDPVFRIHEPLALLKPTYFNHAHNDLLEIVLDAGILGLLLLLAALAWWGWASVAAWRRPADLADPALARIGSIMLLLTVLASAFDYPARTPTMMMLIVVAASWLHGVKSGRQG